MGKLRIKGLLFFVCLLMFVLINYKKWLLITCFIVQLHLAMFLQMVVYPSSQLAFILPHDAVCIYI